MKKIDKIRKLVEEKEDYLQVIGDAETKISKIDSNLRDLRITKLPKAHVKKYEIICVCENIYTSDKDPNGRFKEDRPQCLKCGARIKRK